MTTGKKRGRGDERFIEEAYPRFTKDQMAIILKEGGKLGLTKSEYARMATLKLLGLATRELKSSGDTVHSYGEALNALDKAFREIIKQLDKMKDQPEKVNMLVGHAGRIVTIEIPELYFHLSFKQIEDSK